MSQLAPVEADGTDVEFATLAGTGALASGRSGGARRLIGVLAPPVVFGVAFVAAWQLLVDAANIAAYILPSPSDIFTAAREDHTAILKAAGHSGLNALIGLLLGAVLALLFAAIAAQLPLLGVVITPLVAALAAMPIVALAPLLNNMYSSTSSLPRREVVAISAFVPIFVNVLRGVSRVDRVHADLMSSYAASRFAVLRKIRVPNALPYFFTGLRVASSLAVISAIVTEYFGGLQDGLGSRITSAVGASDYPSAWASVLGAVVLGLLFFLAALGLERLALGRRTAAP